MQKGLETEESLREVMKREEWLAANNDKFNYGNDVYGIDVSQQHPRPDANHHPAHMPKQNGIHHSAADYYKDIYAVQSPLHYDSEHADYTSYAAMIGQEQNVDTGEIWDKRKETTSFEHEQPHSSSIMSR